MEVNIKIKFHFWVCAALELVAIDVLHTTNTYT